MPLSLGRHDPKQWHQPILANKLTSTIPSCHLAVPHLCKALWLVGSSEVATRASCKHPWKSFAFSLARALRVCMCARVCVVCVYVCVCVCACVCVCVFVCLCVCVHVHMCVYVCVYVHVWLCVLVSKSSHSTIKRAPILNL